MTYGIAKIKMKAVIQGSHSNIHTSDSGTTFYFYFEDTGSSFGGSTTPNEYVLLKLESPFSAEIHSDYTALQQYGNGKAGIPVERQSDSVPPWTRPRNRDRSSSISQTLFPPPFSSATRITGLAIIVSLPEGATARSVASSQRTAFASGALPPASASSTVHALPAVLPSSPASAEGW